MEPCDEIIYKYGEVLGAYTKSDEDAENLCNDLNIKNPSCLYDWHYFGGRTVVKVITLKMYNYHKANGAIMLTTKVKALKDLPYIEAGEVLPVEMYIIGKDGKHRVGVLTKCNRIEHYDLVDFEGAF